MAMISSIDNFTETIYLDIKLVEPLADFPGKSHKLFFFTGPCFYKPVKEGRALVSSVLKHLLHQVHSSVLHKKSLLVVGSAARKLALGLVDHAKHAVLEMNKLLLLLKAISIVVAKAVVKLAHRLSF